MGYVDDDIFKIDNIGELKEAIKDMPDDREVRLRTFSFDEPVMVFKSLRGYMKDGKVVFW